jgi:hypothetical protein
MDNAKKLIDAIDKNDTATASSLISSGSVNLNRNRCLCIALLDVAESKS